MNVIVTGANGQLGYDVIQRLLKNNNNVYGTDLKDEFRYEDLLNSNKNSFHYFSCDLTSNNVEKTINDNCNNIDVVIHCAAWTAVDAAEEESNKAIVEKINVTGTKNIANYCKSSNAKLVYISTDYVFDGNGDSPWQPDCKDYNPINFYGQTKLNGELIVKETLEKYFIVRIAWVFGINGKNFINTMLKLSQTHDTLRVVSDQIGTPTYTYDLAILLSSMIQTEKYGYYHATNEGGYISWYDFAVEIFKQANKKVNVIPVTTAEYGLSVAKRPYNSRLDKSKLEKNGFKLLPTWQDALSRYLDKIKGDENNGSN